MFNLESLDTTGSQGFYILISAKVTELQLRFETRQTVYLKILDCESLLLHLTGLQEEILRENQEF